MIELDGTHRVIRSIDMISCWIETSERHCWMRDIDRLPLSIAKQVPPCEAYPDLSDYFLSNLVLKVTLAPFLNVPTIALILRSVSQALPLASFSYRSMHVALFLGGLHAIAPAFLEDGCGESLCF